MDHRQLELCRRYRDLIRAAATEHDWAPELIAGIISRESNFGLLLDKYFKGDRGHGHGLMQIDDRSFGDWLRAHDWRDPAVNIPFGALVLTEKYNWLAERGLLDDLTDAEAERAAVAAYNCGEGKVRRALLLGLSVDRYTGNGNYSRDVLARAKEFKFIFEEE